jgi:hypothetical protein
VPPKKQRFFGIYLAIKKACFPCGNRLFLLALTIPGKRGKLKDGYIVVKGSLSKEIFIGIDKKVVGKRG